MADYPRGYDVRLVVGDGGPDTALTVTRVSRMLGRPRIRFGSTVIRSWAIGLGYLAVRPLPLQQDQCKTESGTITASPGGSRH